VYFSLFFFFTFFPVYCNNFIFMKIICTNSKSYSYVQNLTRMGLQSVNFAKESKGNKMNFCSQSLSLCSQVYRTSEITMHIMNLQYISNTAEWINRLIYRKSSPACVQVTWPPV
jgi:hypothetical protein